MRKSEQLVKELRTINYWTRKLYRCVWIQSALVNDDEDKRVRREIENKIFEIQKLTRDHYAKKIGPVVVQENV